MLLRALSPNEKQPLTMESWTQLALELDNESLVPKIIDLLNKQVIGLHLRVEGNNLIYDPKSLRVIKDPNIQKNIKLSQATQICYNNRPPPNMHLGAIHYNHNKLVLNLSHMCGDGRYLAQQLSNINNLYHYKELRTRSYISPFEICFHDHIERAKNQINPTTAKNTLIKLHHYKNVPHDKYFRTQVLSIPCRELQIYDKSNHTVSGLNEELHTSFILSSIAYSNYNKGNVKISELLNRFGSYSLVDLRKKAERDLDSICNAFGEISINLDVNENNTISDINSRMKKLIKSKINNDEPFINLHKANEANKFNHDILLSNVGRLSLSDHISDCWISTCAEVSPSRPFYGYSFSIVKESQKRNDLYICLTHDNNEFSEKDIQKIELTMKHFMTNIPLNCSVGQALDELLQFIKRA